MKERWVNSPEVLKGRVIKRIGIGLVLSVSNRIRHSRG